MIIANRLRDGVVVFLAPSESWELAIAAGTVIENEEEATHGLKAVLKLRSHIPLAGRGLFHLRN
jgi:hypothetical protein